MNKYTLKADVRPLLEKCNYTLLMRGGSLSFHRLPAYFHLSLSLLVLPRNVCGRINFQYYSVGCHSFIGYSLMPVVESTVLHSVSSSTVYCRLPDYIRYTVYSLNSVYWGHNMTVVNRSVTPRWLYASEHLRLSRPFLLDAPYTVYFALSSK